MRKQLISLLMIILLSAGLFAEVSNVQIVSLVPPAPNAGDSVTLNFTYSRTTDVWNVSHFLVAVSNLNTFQSSNTTGQTFKVANGSINIGGTGDGASAATAGYSLGDGNGATLTNAPYSFTFNIPNTLEGGTYYVIVGGRRDFVDAGGAMPVSQNYVAISIPLPPAAASITKTAENTTVQPGDYILYTIDYRFVNTNSFTITDVVPANCTLVQMSPGGINAGTTAGSALTWNLGNATSTKRGSVWFLVQVNSGTTPGTTINGTAAWSYVDTLSNPGSGVSNDPTVTVDPPFALLKSQSVSTAAIGDYVTYSFDFDISGLSLKSYDAIDTNPITGFTSTGGTWVWDDDPNGGGYILSPQQGSYPHLLRDTPAAFAFGEIISDVWIGSEITAGTNNWDALVVFRDNGLAGAAGKAYGVGISSDGNPANMYLQEVNPPETAWAVRASSNAVSVSSRTWYTIKILVTDAGSGNVRIRAKAWLRGTAEPAIWHIDWTDMSGSTPPPGKVGYQGHEFNPNLYDNLKVLMSPLEATNAVLYDTVPAELTYVGGSGADAYHGAASFASGIVSWNFPGQVVDYSAHIEWWGQVTSCGNIINTGALKPNIVSAPIDSNSVTLDAQCPGTPTITPTITPTFTQTVTETITQTITPTVTPTVTPIFPQLSVIKSVSPVSGEAGTTVLYTIRVSNTGLIPVTGVSVWDTLPAKHSYVSGGSYSPVTNMITFGPDSIATGNFVDYSFSAVILDTINKDEKLYNTAIAGCDLALNNFISNQSSFSAVVPELVLKPEVTVPNPTDGPTTIIYTLSVKADVTIKIFTVSGELIRTIEDIKGVKGINKTLWDGLNQYNQKAASGVYIYKIEAVNGSEKKHAFSKLAVTR